MTAAAPKLSIRLSAGALVHNLQQLEALANTGRSPSEPPVGVLAVVKADAYGHGAALCAPVLARAGVPWLGVTDAAEGALVRESLDSEATTGILVMCAPDPLAAPADAALCAAHQLTPTLWTAAQLRTLAEAHTPGTPPLAFHLEIDTGMARQGVAPGPELHTLLDALLPLAGRVQVGGVFTHFASAEIAGSSQTALQERRFAAALTQLQHPALAATEPLFLHAGNTSTLDDGTPLPALARQAAALARALGRPVHRLARTGLALFGYVLPLEPVAATAHLAGRLRPVATWATRVVSLRDLPAGEPIGYNATQTTTAPTRVALLPIGYADGLRRELSSTSTQPGGAVLLRGALAPILGRVSMNLLTVDVTRIPGVVPGDEAILLGPAPALSADDHARLARTIPYEILCALRGDRSLAP